MGEALGRAGVSVEGGGTFVSHGEGTAHFLFTDGAAARQALEAAGIRVLAEKEVLVQRLNQTEPGQLGKIARAMAEAGPFRRRGCAGARASTTLESWRTARTSLPLRQPSLNRREEGC
jgi:hypothetical protein